MEWIERLNEAINYIEEHLTDTIDYQELAKIACCSTYHFQRMFSYMANVPLSEYIRRRRISLAAVELQSSNKKVIEVGMKYGYESPTAFTRAFQSIHGITPSQARECGTSLKAFPPISFKITIKGDTEMNYRVESKKAFRIIGVSTLISKDIEKNFKEVPMLWQKASQDGTVQKLIGLMKGEPKGILGVSSCNEGEDWKYYIAVANNEYPTNEFEERIIPSSMWAIFSGTGAMPHSIQVLEKRIVTEWLPTSGYEYANQPDIEVYLNADPQNAQFEVWVPVVKKNL